MMRARRQLLRLMVLRESSFGLCATCRLGRTVGNKHGSKFVLCERSQGDPNSPRYPRTPVVQCPGYEAAPSRDRGEAGSSDPLYTKSEAMMEVRLTQQMLTAVKETPEIPDNRKEELSVIPPPRPSARWHL